MTDLIGAVRSFNRFFTVHVGALNPDFLGAGMSLAEARVLFEIAPGQNGGADSRLATDLQAALDMDAGFISRVLKRFEARGWIVRARGGSDGRRRPIALTDAGQAAFVRLDERQRAQVEATLDRLSPSQRDDLAGALTSARLLMGGAPRAFAIRTFRPGDMGMITARQAVLYNEIYGWGAGIEVNIGEATAAFLKDFKPGREQGWVAEIDGAMVGSILLTDEGEGLCRLRLLYVEATARGMGVGEALVDQCLAFARAVGFETMTLWTHTVLTSARRIYAAKGFECVEVAMHEAFGEPVQGETWRLALLVNG